MTDPTPGAAPTVLAEADWTGRRDRHHAAVDALLADHLRRRAADETHPVHDFLFTYYNYRPGKLRFWHPGYGTILLGAATRDYRDHPGYERLEVDGVPAVRVSEAVLAHRSGTVDFVAGLLAATASRPAQLGAASVCTSGRWCTAREPRTSGTRRCRCDSATQGTDDVVESMQLRCTHYDAFRFFTPEAAPRNASALTQDSRTDREQPGCLHAGMDLYKWCFKLSPLVDSDLVLDCFRLASAAREFDMRASPYDLSGYGYSPVAIETAAGRAQYVREQSALTTRAAALREELLNRCSALRACRPDTPTATGG